MASKPNIVIELNLRTELKRLQQLKEKTEKILKEKKEFSIESQNTMNLLNLKIKYIECDLELQKIFWSIMWTTVQRVPVSKLGKLHAWRDEFAEKLLKAGNDAVINMKKKKVAKQRKIKPAGKAVVLNMKKKKVTKQRKTKTAENAVVPNGKQQPTSTGLRKTPRAQLRKNYHISDTD